MVGELLLAEAQGEGMMLVSSGTCCSCVVSVLLLGCRKLSVIRARGKDLLLRVEGGEATRRNAVRAMRVVSSSNISQVVKFLDMDKKNMRTEYISRVVMGCKSLTQKPQPLT